MYKEHILSDKNTRFYTWMRYLYIFELVLVFIQMLRAFTFIFIILLQNKWIYNRQMNFKIDIERKDFLEFNINLMSIEIDISQFKEKS